MRIEAGFDYESDDEPDGRNRRVRAYAEHVQSRDLRQHARELSLFVRQRIRVRR